MADGPERDPDRAWSVEVLPRLIAEARAEAEAEVRSRLRAQMVDALLAAAARARHPDPSPAPTAPAPSHTPQTLTNAARSIAPSGTGLWVYGVMDGGVADPTVGPSVDGRAPVELLRHAGLAALVSEISLDEFGEQPLRDALEDLDRLEALARAHEQVLEAALATGTVIPFRMCTIYETAERVRQMLESRNSAFVAALQRLSGCAEWGVKAFLTGTPNAAAEREFAASGMEYLARKREQRDAAERARLDSEAAIAAVHARLSEQADAAVLGRAQDRKLSGRDAEMVLNASYLVAQERTDDLHRLVDELAQVHAEHGIALELTGPWPPYHFVDEAVSA